MNDANVAWRVADEEAVLLHADSSAYFGLNQTGTLLWAHLAEHPMTLERLSDWVRACFTDAPPGVQTEISTFLDELGKLDLVERVDGPDAVADLSSNTAGDGTRPPWEAPTVERFGELEKLILSGE